MRKLTTGIIVGTALTAGAAGTVAFIGTSSTDAAPPLPRHYCGQFDGVGPAPDCSYVVNGNQVVIGLRNNGIRPSPVRCDLIPSGQRTPIDSTTLGPGGRGSVAAGMTPGVPRVLLLNCRSITVGAPEVARHTSLTISAPRSTVTKKPTTRQPTRTTRQRTPDTSTRPSRTLRPRTTPPQTTPPQTTGPQTQTTTPHATTTTTTTTTMSGG